jgi:hypothetical protein
MKKVLLALLLLVVVVGIAYLTAWRNQASEKKQYQDGYVKGSAEVTALKKESDSLRTAVQKREMALTDSIKQAGNAYAGLTDSLRGVIASKDSIITVLRSRKPAPSVAKANKPAPAQSSTAPAKQQLPNHAQILDYYKRRLHQLPTDLSAYERKVAVNEIREETAHKFSVSAADVDRIRQSGNLNE